MAARQTKSPPKVTPALVAAHGLKPDEYERLKSLIGRPPKFTELGIFSAMWNEHCSYKSSKIHLQDAAHQGALGDPGAGRERRRHRHRRRARLRVQDGEPQPPELHRALSGRDHRRRRHPARRLHHGRAADRLPQRAVVRRAVASEDAPARRRRGRGHRRLRQFLRRADGRRRGALPHPLRRQLPGQRHGGRASPRPTRSSTRRRPASACRSSISAPRPAATASMAPPWRRRSSTTIPTRSARPCRSAIRSPRSSCSKPASRSWPRIA